MPTLTNASIRNLKPQGRVFRKADGFGLCLEVTPSGSKLWRFRYRYGGKPNMLSLGAYPEVSLAEARRRRDKLREMLAQGIDPAMSRRAEKARALELGKATFDSAPRRGPAVRPVSAAEITPEVVRWLWDGWLAKGKLHILAGKPGTGKTTLALALAATVTTGGAWPDGTRCDTPGDVIIWSGEDDPADTIVPRLMAAGADLRRVHFVGGIDDPAGEPRPFDPAFDVPLLAKELKRLRPALLIFDPIISAVAGDAHKGNDVRRALQPLVDLARSVDCAVLGITHLSTGSVSFGALAHIVLLALKHENPGPDDATRLLVRSKSNIGPDEGGIGYDLEQAKTEKGIWASRIRWADIVEGIRSSKMDQRTPPSL